MNRTSLTPLESETVTATSSGATLTSPTAGRVFVYLNNLAGSNNVCLSTAADVTDTRTTARLAKAGELSGPFGPFETTTGGVLPVVLYAASSTSGVVVTYELVASE